MFKSRTSNRSSNRSQSLLNTPSRNRINESELNENELRRLIRLEIKKAIRESEEDFYDETEISEDEMLYDADEISEDEEEIEESRRPLRYRTSRVFGR